MIELPLAILLWMMVGFSGLVVVLGVVAVVAGTISEYHKHKRQLAWDKMMNAVRSSK